MASYERFRANEGKKGKQSMMMTIKEQNLPTTMVTETRLIDSNLREMRLQEISSKELLHSPVPGAD